MPKKSRSQIGPKRKYFTSPIKTETTNEKCSDNGNSDVATSTSVTLKNANTNTPPVSLKDVATNSCPVNLKDVAINTPSINLKDVATSTSVTHKNVKTNTPSVTLKDAAINTPSINLKDVATSTSVTHKNVKTNTPSVTLKDAAINTPSIKLKDVATSTSVTHKNVKTNTPSVSLKDVATNPCTVDFRDVAINTSSVIFKDVAISPCSADNKDDVINISSVNVRDAATSPIRIISDKQQTVNNQGNLSDMSNFEKLKSSLAKIDFEPFVCVKTANSVRFVQFYDEDAASVKLSVVIKKDCTLNIFVHNVPIPSDHDIWQNLPSKVFNVETVNQILENICSYEVCIGNTDTDFQDLVPPNCGLSHPGSVKVMGYREGDVGASSGEVRYNSTIRSTGCNFLCLKARSPNLPRCSACSKYRASLRTLRYRREQNLNKPKVERPLIKSTKAHSLMSRKELILKCNQYKVHCLKLEVTVEKLKSQISAEISSKGEILDESDNVDMRELMDDFSEDVIKSFPDASCYQRLFWDQQRKYCSMNNKTGMRWHPMMIKWCLYLRSRSKSTYSALRDMGFMNLPSERTLFDYSHVTKGRTGFNSDVINQLIGEVNDIRNCDWKTYVGLLQDEIKIKQDLVYDKHTGQLVGFTSLDEIGNSIIDMQRDIENSDTSKNLAKYVLVLMVRGVATDLKFPMAHFASGGITADFLYPIIWQAIEILEVTVGLKVLFVTCDGASPNRKFFKLHHLPLGIQDSHIYCTPNPYSFEDRHLYLISDVPHLVKTTRNCFANSYAHKKSRKMWFNKDISWMHIVDLYENGVGNGLYNLCPKLSRSHIDLTSFSCMKVKLAAQVLSDTVANALEFTKYEATGATVKFIRMMNKFFDTLNTRNLFEARNSRNPNIAPYEDANDDRLQWLLCDFLSYFEEWKLAVTQRQGQFSKQEHSTMMLSYQTIEGLNISVKSIVACVKYMLNIGAPFILTEVFNQDVLEQHFGHHRANCGSNTNPTVNDINQHMGPLRVIGSKAVASAAGNTKRKQTEQIVDNTKLAKLKRGR